MAIHSNSPETGSASGGDKPPADITLVESPPNRTNGKTKGDGLAQENSLSQLGAVTVDAADWAAPGITTLSGLASGSPVKAPIRPEVLVVNRRLTVFAVILGAVCLLLLGLLIGNFWFELAGSVTALFISVKILWNPIRRTTLQWAAEPESAVVVATVGGFISLLGVLKLLGGDRLLTYWYNQLNWDAVGALGEVFGALGQILIAVLAVYIAWRQYVIEKDLTIQQNTITQQQTIDSYFQGISELVLDEEGLLEDWPQERAIAEGRTAAILGSVDAGGKAKVIRFLSCARLLTPLKRDQRLGRAILDGTGGYEEDREFGVRVIDVGVMLAGADLSATDLRWTDLSEANLIRGNLSYCDLVKTNFSRTILAHASLRGADLNGTRFFYGRAEDASPRSRTVPPDYQTGECTGAVIEQADFSDASHMSPEQRYYCCAWGGTTTRSTVPGGCEGIPNKLGR
ncbi:pentapeptide repeat-containing protein [Kovacikia minuta CCNUW1]|uniref:pentapeptide repeat-containing protein n=1 Tax=Kovacikia minuta TaxID=2931930 RepID=UPI001CCC74E0|nr:pentapeptide repeat-containing protein [Kovacikia minuta]UBF28178.1 pentapeptide repeat-containing protein [Kovacikia minuta CCNUW1]